MKRSLIAAVLLAFVGAAFASEPLPDGHGRYIVVVHSSVKGAAKGVAAEAKAVGATVEADLGDRIVITGPPSAIETLRRHEAVRYVQTAVLGVPSPERVDREVQATSIRDLPLQTHSGLTWNSGDYLYDGAGNIASIGSAAAPGTQGYRTYGYDAVARLTKAQINGVTPGGTHEYSYDVYGNRTGQALNSQWTTVGVNTSTNRLNDASYDTRGNQTARGVTAATYDGFDMVTSYRYDGINVETYVYTANDERIGVLRGNDWTWSLRDDGGNVLRQYRSSATNPTAPWLWVEDFVYREGLLLGSERMAEEGGRRHYHLDHLGSPRLVTGASGSLISEHDFLPFGEERTSIGQHLARGFDREEPFRFTSHERDFDILDPNDSSSYVDYLHARHYATKAGRFFTPDPILGNLLRPQSWNRYAYVLNSPINLSDPTGMKPVIRHIQGGAGSFTCIDGVCAADIMVTARDPLHDFFVQMTMMALSGIKTTFDVSNARNFYSNASYRMAANGNMFGSVATETLLNVLPETETGLVLQIGSLAAGGVIGRAVGAGTTTLYRAVSQAELADIAATGVLRAGPNAISTGKFFAESAAHARAWGTAMDGAGNFRVIAVRVSRDVAAQMMRWERLDAIGPARFGTFSQLTNAVIKVLR